LEAFLDRLQQVGQADMGLWNTATAPTASARLRCCSTSFEVMITAGAIPVEPVWRIHSMIRNPSRPTPPWLMSCGKFTSMMTISGRIAAAVSKAVLPSAAVATR